MLRDIKKDKLVITIGREYGSGGHEIAKRLAKKLDIPFYDKEIAHLVSEKGDLAEKYLLKNEEKAPSYWDFAIPSQNVLSTYYYQSVSQTIFLEQAEMIKELAKKGACIIVGRAADYVLRTIGSINVFIYASLDSRINRKIELLKENENKTFEAGEMKKLVKSVDKKRSKYYKYYTSQNWGEKENYDICINTDKFGIDGAVEAIAALLENFELKKEN